MTDAAKRQQPGESFETFVTDLRNLVKDCKYNNPDEMVRDRIVSAGVISQETREKQLTEGDDLSLAKAIDITMLYEVTKKQLASMAASAGNNVDALRLGRNKQHSHHGPKSTPVPDKHPCRNCGGKHGKKECPAAFGKTCSYCRKQNHYARVCLKKQKDHAKQAIYI